MKILTIFPLKKSIMIMISTVLFNLYNPLILTAQTVIIEADQLRVREGPSSDYAVIGHVDRGDTFPFLKHASPWIKIDYFGSTGYIHEEYVTVSNKTTTERVDDVFKEPDPVKDKKNSTSLPKPYDSIQYPAVNLRDKPSVHGTILSTLTAHTQIDVLNVDEDWLKIKVISTGEIGFIRAHTIEKNKQKSDLSLFNKTIVIDPGHGGVDVGAIGRDDVYESTMNFKTSIILKHLLEDLGATVILTREDDLYYSLTSRAIFSNYHLADLFISIHYNSTPDAIGANGINTYYRLAQHEALAQTVHDQLIKNTAANDRGFDSVSYSVLRNTVSNNLLLELGFLSHESESIKIQDDHYQMTLARSISEAINDYYTNE